jgi:ABC-2 type transport system permease protein
MTARRVTAVARWHWLGTIQSPTRLIDMFFWPVVDLTLWGLITAFLEDQDIHLAVPVAFLLGGLLLWDIVFRTKNGIAVAFLSESHWHNVVNLMASPLDPSEYLAGVVLYALSRAAVSWVMMIVLAVVLFAFNVVALGPVLVLYVGLLLMFGVALSLVVLGLVLRFGEAVEEMAWAIAGVVVPFAAVFYPLSALPGWARAVGRAMPPAWVFESMRSVLAGRPAGQGQLVIALLLNVVYIAAAGLFAGVMLGVFRRRGFVTRYM